MEIISSILLIMGGLFLALGGFGIFRMPDIFNRIQAGTKASTLGTFSLLLGVGLYHIDSILKVILIIIFIAISNPVGSSVIAKAAYKSQTKPSNLVIDELESIRGDDNA